MVSRLCYLANKWMELSPVTVLILIVALNRVDCTTTTPTPGGMGCSDDDVASLGNRDPCSREYLRCENSSWRRAMCVGGIINNGTRECLPYSQECPDPGVTVKTFTSRFKRQASATNNCLRSYRCPADLKRVFIYPDWVNEKCDSYIVCASGTLLVSSCIRDGYNYYNPARLSCEEIASPTNICVNRRNTVFGS